MYKLVNRLLKVELSCYRIKKLLKILDFIAPWTRLDRKGRMSLQSGLLQSLWNNIKLSPEEEVNSGVPRT